MKHSIFIDGWCPNCRRFARFIKVVDLFNQLEIMNIRTDSHSLVDQELAIKKMAIVTPQGKVKYGYQSIKEIFKSLILIWPIYPIIFILEKTNLGEYLYHELSVRRKIIPLHCDNDICNFNQ